MAVAYDAVGPSGGAGQASTTASITWSHASVGTSGLAGVVAVAQDASTTTNAAYTLTATWGGSSMTSLGRVASANTTTYGYIQLFGLISPPTGTQTVTVTCSGTPPHLIGGSISFTGAGSFGTAVTAFGTSTSASVTVTGTSTTNMYVAGFCGGQSLGTTPTSPLTKRWLKNVSTVNGAGNGASGTAPGTAAAQALAWPLTSNAWGAVGVEVQAATAAVDTADFCPFFM